MASHNKERTDKVFESIQNKLESLGSAVRLIREAKVNTPENHKKWETRQEKYNPELVTGKKKYSNGRRHARQLWIRTLSRRRRDTTSVLQPEHRGTH